MLKVAKVARSFGWQSWQGASQWEAGCAELTGLTRRAYAATLAGGSMAAMRTVVSRLNARGSGGLLSGYGFAEDAQHLLVVMLEGPARCGPARCLSASASAVRIEK